MERMDRLSEYNKKFTTRTNNTSNQSINLMERMDNLSKYNKRY